MLVLTRKRGQSILLGEAIEVTILEISRDSVKIGINAPKNVEILRKELYEEIKKTNLESIVKSRDILKELSEK
ncbi:MAG TPA: carbon storage regulator CsrA [bacterium]|jgi:carbon storage regulator|nr:carbon storage regulator CsrA [Dictyoglomota bacterium]HHV80880.1 carbon storage regulator CsrA [bacterium]HOP55882.1 carbon storage regulator CsrA [bacterium]